MKILIFTQKVDKDDSVLGFFHEWILEFSKKCEQVDVVCYGKGYFDLPSNVRVYSIGKEQKLGRIMYAINLIKYIYQLSGQYDRVFVHMNPEYVVLFGWYWKLKRIPVYLWYVHRSVNLKLRIAVLFSKKVFTSTKESLKIETDKVVYLGHGIDVDELKNTPHLFNGEILKIVHIGRITPIKNIEFLIESTRQLKDGGLKVQAVFYGECIGESDKKYKVLLDQLIAEKGLKNEVFFQGGIKHRDLSENLKEAHLSVNLTPPGGMDKAVLESFLLGIPAFTANTAFSSLFGEYSDIFLYRFGDPSDLTEKINSFLNNKNNQEILKILDSKIRNDFSLGHLVDKIIQIMK